MRLQENPGVPAVRVSQRIWLSVRESCFVPERYIGSHVFVRRRARCLTHNLLSPRPRRAAANGRCVPSRAKPRLRREEFSSFPRASIDTADAGRGAREETLSAAVQFVQFRAALRQKTDRHLAGCGAMRERLRARDTGGRLCLHPRTEFASTRAGARMTDQSRASLSPFRACSRCSRECRS